MVVTPTGSTRKSQGRPSGVVTGGVGRTTVVDPNEIDFSLTWSRHRLLLVDLQSLDTQ